MRTSFGYFDGTPQTGRLEGRRISHEMADFPVKIMFPAATDPTSGIAGEQVNSHIMKLGT